MAEAGYYYCETLLNLIDVIFFYILDPFSFVFCSEISQRELIQMMLKVI